MGAITQQITGNEAFWGALKGQLANDILREINASQTLVNELLQYGMDVTNKKMQPMSISLDGSYNLLQFTGKFVQFGSNFLSWSTEQFVGNLSHEIGHYTNFSNDQEFYEKLEINPDDPGSGALYDAVGLHAEGEAVVNNWKVQQEISQNTGAQIYINGDGGANGAIDKALSNLHASDMANGLTQAQDNNAMIELAGKMFSSLHPSDTPAGTTYADLYAAHGGEIFSSMGIAPGNVLPGAIAEVDFSDPNLSGNLSGLTEKFTSGASASQYFFNGVIGSAVQYDQFGNILTQTVYSHNADGSYVANIYDGQGHATGQNQFHSDGSQVDYVFNANGTQTATVFNVAGHETEYATFGTNGAKTQDIFFDATTGRETQENDFNADGSQVDHLFNTNGTQTAYVFNAAGHETEQATFGTNGAKTQDLFYDATSGRLTQENDFNADGSQVDHLFNANGTQTAYVFNAAGHETEQATFGANGAKTQDLFYDGTTGRETQENDFNADGSQVDHLFNANGTQTAYVFNAAGHETEQATFGTNGKITQDLVYDGTTGRELQETDYNTNGSGVAHIFNPDGTQNAAVFDPSGHISEYATYGTNGKITSDAFYDANGRETQLNEYSGNQTTVHIINADNTQTATVYNSANQETEFAQFDAGGHKTDDYFFNGPTGRETQYDHYGSDGSMVAKIFNSDNSSDIIFYGASGLETEYQAYNSQGQLTGFTDFTYTVGEGYDAIAYGPTGYETGWADYGSTGTQISSSGGLYNFTLDDGYGAGTDWGFTLDPSDSGYSSDYGFYI